MKHDRRHCSSSRPAPSSGFVSFFFVLGSIVRITASSRKLHLYVSRSSSSYIRRLPRRTRCLNPDVDIYLDTASVIPQAPQGFVEVGESPSDAGVFHCFRDRHGNVYVRGENTFFLGNPVRGRLLIYLKRMRFSRSLIMSALALCLKYKGYFALHSALVTSPNSREAYLIAGESGCGKTTLALNLRKKGYTFKCDDLCLVSRAPQGRGLVAFPLDKDSRRSRQEQTRLAKKGLSLRGWHSHECLPRAMVFPVIARAAKSKAVTLSQSSAVIRLIGLSLLMCFEDRKLLAAHMRILRDLSKQCRSFELRAGKDRDEVCDSFDRLVKAAR